MIRQLHHAGSGPSVLIGSRRVASDAPVLVIAEAGVNHNGRPDEAVRLVDAAADAGADAVKLQVFRAAELTTCDAPLATYQRESGQTGQRALLERLELSDATLRKVVERCRERHIAFLGTPFAVADVDRLVALGAPAIKIASTDLSNVPLLEAAARTELPLIVSTGASTAYEIVTAVQRITGWGASGRLILLHCVSCYPTPLGAANLRAIHALEKSFGVPCGFSDHTQSTAIGGWAVAAGACVLEKHFTLDRSAPGPDHGWSLAPQELRAYIAHAREAEAARGSGHLGMTAIEQDVRRVARRSVVAARGIPAGVELTRDMLALKRPAGGIEPGDLERLIGRRTRVALVADQALGWEQLA